MSNPCHTPFFFFFNDTATTEIYTLSLHDALPICEGGERARDMVQALVQEPEVGKVYEGVVKSTTAFGHLAHLGLLRSEEHTSELQSLAYLVCRLLLEKKKNTNMTSVFLQIAL